MNPRHQALAEMAKAHDERIAAEMTPVEGMEAAEFEPAPKVEPKLDGEEVHKEERADPKADEHVEVKTEEKVRDDTGKFAKKDEPVEKVTVKIYDETMEVPKADVDALGGVASYQIQKASEKRLAKLNATTAEVTAMKAELARLIAEHKKPVADVTARTEAAKTEQDEKFKKNVETLRFGTNEEEVLRAARELNAPPATIPVEQIVYRATKQMELEQAEKAFIESAKDVLYDQAGKLRPLVVQTAAARSQALRADIQKTGRFPDDVHQFYKNMETEFRREFGGKQAPATDLSARIEKKKDMAEPQTASGRETAKADEKPPTVGQVIDAARKARGQKQLYH